MMTAKASYANILVGSGGRFVLLPSEVAVLIENRSLLAIVDYWPRVSTEHCPA